MWTTFSIFPRFVIASHKVSMVVLYCFLLHWSYVGRIVKPLSHLCVLIVWRLSTAWIGCTEAGIIWYAAFRPSISTLYDDSSVCRTATFWLRMMIPVSVVIARPHVDDALPDSARRTEPSLAEYIVETFSSSCWCSSSVNGAIFWSPTSCTVHSVHVH